jgi:hypothetical protein
MRRLIAIAAIAATAFMPSAAWAWGNEGHRIVALIAAQDLSPAAKTQIADLLDSTDATDALARYSTWADEIRPQRRDTAPWHYVDIEIGSSGYVASRDCSGGDCVVAQVERDISILKNRQLAKPVRAEAIRFLIHFVGDMHQPLHCSDNHDRGGNQVRVVLNGRTTNLHAVWDTPVVEALGDDPATIAADLHSRITPAERATWTKGTAEQWANECFAVAKQNVYATLTGTGPTDAPIILPPDYAQRQAEVTRAQLERAGVRLATLLNKVLGK